MRTHRLAATLLFLLAAPAPSLAGTICLQIDDGNLLSYAVMKGGKIDKKPFAARVIFPGACEMAATAVAVRGEDGSLRLSISAGASPPCTPVFYYATTDDDLNGAGGFWAPMIASQGPVTFSRISCSLTP